MITRRESVLGGLLTIISTAAPCLCQAKAVRSLRATGCRLNDEDAASLFSTSTLDTMSGNEPIIMSSGNRDLDYAIAQTLSRLTDAFKVLPSFAYYADNDGANAFATPVQRMTRTDGTVLFGLNLLKRQLSAPEAPDAAVAAVCAHEYGHILQYKLRLIEKLKAGQSSTRRSELNADFFAGYFAGVSKRKRPNYPAAVYATSIHAIGDYNVNSRTHHGTPTERANAVIRGFETGYRDRRSLSDAIQIGVNYVMTL